jgi:hypothetical protein
MILSNPSGLSIFALTHIQLSIDRKVGRALHARLLIRFVDPQMTHESLLY